MSARKSSVARLVIALVLLTLSIGIFFNRQTISDQIIVWQYKPDTEIAQISSRASLNSKGTFLLYAAQPMVQSREDFNANCSLHTEKSVVLGCYDGRYIYLYDIDDPRLDGIKEVTAAHEMLHVAYARLSDQERLRVNAMIDDALPKIGSERIEKRIALYDQDDPSVRYNELHSMLGTEVKNLPEPLTAYYDQYFINRLSLVLLSERYETVFVELETRQQQLVAELNALATDITAQSDQYSQEFQELQQDILAFNEQANSGSFSTQAAFNAQRSQLVARQSALNSQRNEINRKIVTYQDLSKELEELNLTAQDLQRSIDSRLLPEVPSI